MMEYCKLGKTDLKISRIGFGTMSLELNNPLTGKILNEALDGGINYFDTADLYQQGLNESFLGRTLKGRRNQLILATKVGNQWRADGSGWHWAPSKKYILEAIEKSLVRLQTDYIDLYQLHGGTLDDPIDEIIETFEELKSAGKIRFYGISSIRPNVIREYVKRSSMVSVMIQYSLLDRRPEEEMLSYLYENEVGVLARGSVAKGLLLSKPAEPYLNYSAAQVALAAQAVRSVSDKLFKPSKTAIQFVLHHPAISSAMVGIRTLEQLQDVLMASHPPLLSDLQIKKLKEILPANIYQDYR